MSAEEVVKIIGEQGVFVMPGEEVDPLKLLNPDQAANIEDRVIRLGPGLYQREDKIICTAAGLLYHNQKENRFWVDFNLKRYVPVEGDSVIGVVTKRLGEAYVLDIGSASQANLSAYAFEGATKRSKPNINVGDLIYAKITLAHKDIEPELEAFNSYTGKSEGFGSLKGGHVFKCSLGLCRRLLHPQATVLTTLGASLGFEIAIGINGLVWVSGPNPKATILIRNAILNSEFITDSNECQIMVSKLLEEL